MIKTPTPDPKKSHSLSQEELRAAALNIVEQQYAKRQEATPVVGLAKKAQTFKSKGTLAAASDGIDTESSDGLEEDIREHAAEGGFQITQPIPLSARRPSHALHTTPKGTIPCWAYILCILCIAGATAFTVYWVNRPEVVWQWEILPDYTQQAVLRATVNATTPQAQAWEWLQQHPDFDQLTEWRVFQLMGVATFYYANYYLKAWPPLEIEPTFPHECEWWRGSRCNDEGHYTKLSLYQRDMDGSLPRQLGFLSHLQELTFSDNQLTGALPSQLGELTALTFLGLHSNLFAGSLPTQLGRLTALSQLSLRKNDLAGPLPSQLGRLTSVLTMDLSANRLTGSIPLQCAQLSALSYLPLWGNRNLTGALPSQLGVLTKLTALDVHDTNLEGSIPTELQNLLRMRSLLLHDTLLSGTIPASLCEEAVNLEEIWVDCEAVNCTCQECWCGDGPQ